MSAVTMRSGRQVDPSEPDGLSIMMIDVAAHLSKICCYGGATQIFYSEAQHALLVAHEMTKTTDTIGALYGLLHDAGIAVPCQTDAQRQNVMAAIFKAMRLEWPIPEAINRALIEAHGRVVLAEIVHLTRWDAAALTMLREGLMPASIAIRPLAPDNAMDRFVKILRCCAIVSDRGELPAMEGLR